MEIARAVAERLSPEVGVRALFLAGSFGAGTQDAWSDLDLVAVAEPEWHRAAAAALLGAVSGVAPLVMRRERWGRGALVNVITEDWQRCDLVLVPPADFAEQNRARNQLGVLLDRDALHARLPATLPPRAPDPARVAFLVEELICVLGLLPVGLGRGEPVLLVKGAELLRDLMLVRQPSWVDCRGFPSGDGSASGCLPEGAGGPVDGLSLDLGTRVLAAGASHCAAAARLGSASASASRAWAAGARWSGRRASRGPALWAATADPAGSRRRAR